MECPVLVSESNDAYDSLPPLPIPLPFLVQVLWSPDLGAADNAETL